MNFNEFPYNFHDSVIVSCSVEKQNRMILLIQLYEIYYPTKQIIKLVFSGIKNFSAVNDFVNNLSEQYFENNWNGSRIDELDYNKSYLSKNQDLNIVLDIDGLQKTNINCKKFTTEIVLQY